MLHSIRSLIRDSKQNAKYKYWSLTKNGIKNQKVLSELNNKYKGERCFILGNGPSLLKNDLTYLQNEITISSNRNYLIWDNLGFTPTFYTVEDALVAQNWQSEINSLEGIFKIFPKDLSQFLNVKVGVNGVYVNFNRNHENFPSFSLNAFKEVFWGGTVTVYNLQLAYYLGFSKIYLIGIDHNYNITNANGDIMLNSNQLTSENYIHPNYMENGKKMYTPNTNRMESGYIKAMEILKRFNIQVFNATVGGKLEVFPRVDYNTLF